MSTNYPAWILERSFGGLGTAVSPKSGGYTANWPDGRSSPMSREACDALEAACNGGAGEDDPKCMVLLVGGAGNGKSKLAADTVRAIDGTFIGNERAFAQRVYRYDLKYGGHLRVINDATIPRPDRHGTPLVRDLAEAIEAGDHLLACINRGVLISETGNEGPSAADPRICLASKIANWLLSGKIEGTPVSGTRFELIDEDSMRGHYSAATIYEDDTPRTVVHVVYMDRTSLLEHWTDFSSGPGDYRSALPTSRIDVTPILSEDRQSRETAFEACLTGAAKTYAERTRFEALDPVGANAMSLSHQRIARGWCSLMRGAEVEAGTHFTYRELWALFSHSVVGPATRDGLETLASWVRGRLDQIKTATGEERLSALLGLGTLRTHMLLFDAGRRPTAPSSLIQEYVWPNTVNEALNAVHLADPLRNFGPADGKETTSLAERLSWIEEGRLPGDELSEEDEDFAAYWTELDAEIERVTRDEVDPRNDRSTLAKRNWLLSWYGRYMYRLVGLVRGWPAHCTVVDQWQTAWVEADELQRLSSALQEAILDIVLPSLGGGAETFVTFMQPRVDTGDVAAERAMIALPRNRFEVRARTEGDRVQIEIVQGGHGDVPPAAVVSLDFHYLREAISRSNGHGFSDSLMLIEPRVERTRASIVAHQLSQPANRHRFKFSHRGTDVKAP